MARPTAAPPHPAERYLDPSLAPLEQTALIAIAGGVTEARALARCPGLANQSRRDAAIECLFRRGYVVRNRGGTLSLATVVAERGCSGISAAERRRSLGSKLQSMFDWFVHRGRYLLAYGYSAVMAVLDDAGIAWLSDLVRELKVNAADDRILARSLRHSRLAYVIRRVPREFLDVDGVNPRPAPADALVRATAIVLGHQRVGHASAAFSRRLEVRELFEAVQRLGELPLAHWWRIVEESAGVSDPEERWSAVLLRSASYLYQHRCMPAWLRDRVQEREELVRDFPVPACGYGAWVEAELELYRRFCRRYGTARGPFTRALWAQAHGAAEGEMRLRYPGYAPEPHWEQEYEYHLWQQADAIAGLDDDVLEALDRGEYDHPTVRACYRGARCEWEAFERRREWRSVLRHARDDAPASPLGAAARPRQRAGMPKPRRRRRADDLLRVKRVVDLDDSSEESWAPRLVVFWVREATGVPVDRAALDLAEDQWRHVLRNRRRRTPRPRIAVQVHYWAGLDRAIHVPASGLASVDEIAARIRGVADRVRWHTEPLPSDTANERRRRRSERLAGLYAVAELYARRQSAVLEYDRGDTRPCTLGEALVAARAESLLWTALRDAGLVRALGRPTLHRLFAASLGILRPAA